ncbi:MAG: IPT/TIG domain-containing protein [Candidatus Acidiferrales bacterium]
MRFDDWNLRRIKSSFATASRFVMNHRIGASILLSAILLAVAILPLIGQQQQQPAARQTRKGESERDSALQIRKRAQWFFNQRAFPLGYIPADARVKAVRQKEQMRQANGTYMGRFAASEAAVVKTGARTFGNLPITISSTQWTPLGPQPTSSSFFGLTSGRMNALAVDPCDATGNTVYAGAAEGGVWKTTDGGTTWTPLTDNQLSVSSGSLALDPVPGDCVGGHTGAIYYGTGEENFAYDSFYGAGVLISHDGGSTWAKDNTFVSETAGTPPTITPQNSGEAGPFIGTISVDPATSGGSQVLLAAVEGVSTQSHSGIWRSTDGGMDWTLDQPSSYSGDNGAFDNATSVAFDPNDSTGNTAFAALGVPFCTGTNGACDSTTAQGNNGLYESTNNGQSWTRVPGLDTAATGAGLSSANYGRITIALGPSPTPNDPTHTEIVVAIADITTSSFNLLGVFKSVNGGSTFTAITTGSAPVFCNAQCFYDMTVGIDPTNANKILLGGGPAALGRDASGNTINAQCGSFSAGVGGVSDVIISVDDGQSWNDATCDNSTGNFIHVDTHAFAFDPNGTVYVGNDGGVWSSPSGSGSVLSGTGQQTWNDLNGPLNLTQFYPGNSISPSNPEIAFAGSQDNGTQQFNPANNGNLSNPQNWIDTAACGDGGWTAIDPSTPSTIYAACEAIGQLGEINKNQEDGFPGSGQFSNWIELDTPAMDADNANFVPPMVIDPTTPQNIYFGTSQVWQSTNGGISWAAIFNTASGAGCSNGCVLTALDVAPNSSGTVYGGTDTGAVFVSTNATAASPTFSEIDTSSMPGRQVTGVSVSSMNSQVAFVGFSGFSSCSGCDGLGHIYEYNASNGGQPWTNITGNLPDTPVDDIVVDPNDSTNSTLYVATDVGVFMTTNANAATPAWTELAPGLPQVECTSLKLNETARILQVGTHGRGVWDLQLGGLPASALTGIFPTSTTVGTGITLTLNGQGFPNNPNVNFGTTLLTPTASSATQITVTVPTTAVANSGVVPVSIAGGTPANSLNFSVEGPQPTLSGVSPLTVTAGTAATLTVSGSGFSANTELLWTPSSSGTQNGISTALAQNANSFSCNGGNCQFTVTVPANLSTVSLTQVVPAAPVGRGPHGPGAFWLLAAFCAAIIGMLLLINVPTKRRLVLGATLTTVFLLALIGGCSSSGPPPNNGGGGGGSVTIVTNAYNPAPGGGLSTNSVNVTDQQ